MSEQVDTTAAAQGEAETASDTGNIIAADILDPRWPDPSQPDAFDLVFKVKRDSNEEEVEVSLEVSMATLPKNQQMTRLESALAQLKSIGYEFGEDFSRLDTLVGKNVGIYGSKFYAKKSGKPYWAWYFSSVSRRRVSNFAERLAKMRANAGGGGEVIDPALDPFA